MKLFVIASPQGGIGKTTVARKLALYATQQGLKTVCVDLDLQASLTNAMRPASHQQNPDSGGFLAPGGATPLQCSAGLYLVAAGASLAGAEQNLDNAISIALERFESFAEDFDVCVVDTAPGSLLAKLAFAIESYVISPLTPLSEARKRWEQGEVPIILHERVNAEFTSRGMFDIASNDIAQFCQASTRC